MVVHLGCTRICRLHMHVRVTRTKEQARDKLIVVIRIGLTLMYKIGVYDIFCNVHIACDACSALAHSKHVHYWRSHSNIFCFFVVVVAF